MVAAERTRIAVGPDCWRVAALADAVERAGGDVTDLDSASALVLADPQNPAWLSEVLHPGIEWVQLPYAGIEPFLDLLDRDRLWTCGKGVYARPVAEHALALMLAGLRGLRHYLTADQWTGPIGANLHGAHVLVLGGGGITEELLPLLAPFGCQVTVCRRRADAFPGANRTISLSELAAVLPTADIVILALAVTPDTVGVIGAHELALMRADAWLINVARGVHVVTEDLVAALASGEIAGAALDVTDPEPLPPGHPLWSAPNCIITPHVANTPEMGLVLLADRVEENVRRWIAGEPLVGPVDLEAGY